MYTCANCTVLACANNAPEKMPKNCPMRNASVMEAARAGYDLPENHDFYPATSPKFFWNFYLVKNN